VAKRLEHDSDDDWVGGWIFYLFMEDNTKWRITSRAALVFGNGRHLP
jgi:hypothetical protein